MTEQKTTLDRSLGLGGVVLFGLAYMAPMIVFGTFGVLAVKSEGTAAGAYVLALAAILLTAYSYGRMVSIHPVSGSAYAYTRRSVDARAGFLVGWAVLLDYFFLPMVIWLIGAAYLAAALPAVPHWVWVVAFIVLTTAINVIGIQFASRINVVLMVAQFLIVGAFVALAVRYVVVATGADSLLSVEPFFRPGVPISATLAGAALAAYSFLGFDAVSTLAEETVEPRKTMPRAIFLIAVIGGAIYVVAGYVTELAHPSDSFADVDAGAFEIARHIGGDVFVTVFLVGMVVTQFTAGLSAQASVGRLLYAMGRDGVLPKRIFGYLHKGFRTPALNIAAAGLFGLLALVLDETTSTSFINFGAFTAFTFVNLSVIGHYLRHKGDGTRRGVLLWILVPALGAAFDLALLASLDSDAQILGASWLTLGVVYLAVLTRGFRRPPPDLDIEAAEGATERG
jgi:amino acid transporter